VDWERFADLDQTDAPTLVIGGRHDTMDPAPMGAMSKRLPKGQYLYLPEGSHLAIYDDQERYFARLGAFLLGL
jgi:proline iminopeptidase